MCGYGIAGRVSKTSRDFVKRLSAWLESHRYAPFFVFLPAADPHHAFEPYPPSNRIGPIRDSADSCSAQPVLEVRLRDGALRL